jgi:hypothetical protein
MKVLVLCHSLYPYNSANTSIIYRLVNEIRNNSNIEFIFLGNLNNNEQRAIKEYQGCRVYYVGCSILDKLLKKILVFKKMKLIEKILYMIKNPYFIFKVFYNKAFPGQNYSKLYIEAIKNVLREVDISCILAVSYPYFTLLAAKYFGNKIPIIPYKLDPWAYNYYNKKKEKYHLQKEMQVDDCAKYIIITKEMSDSYKNTPLRKNVKKVIQVEYPCNFIKNNANKCNCSKYFIKDKDVINCVYTGSFYKDIRNPSFLFDIMLKITSNHIILHVFDKTFRSFPEEIKNRYLTTNNIIFHNEVPAEVVTDILNSSDILVNLGNTVTNQIPSKLFEYIGTGKPIINIYKRDSCPSLKYLKEYKLHIDIFEDYENIEDCKNKFIEFCNKNEGKMIELSEIQSIYNIFSTEKVAQKIYNILNKSMV